MVILGTDDRARDLNTWGEYERPRAAAVNNEDVLQEYLWPVSDRPG